MRVATGVALSAGLRAMAAKVRQRLWICSPFVGSWDAVTRLLDVNWYNSTKIDVRLLTDTKNIGFLDPRTIAEFDRRGQIRHLPKVHAKVVIVDDIALLTSANLTGYAFSKRYEIGVFLTKVESAHVIDVFENQWWPIGSTPTHGWLKTLKAQKPKGTYDDEPSGPSDPSGVVNPLPPPPKGVPTISRNGGGGYGKFLHSYRRFAQTYEAAQRLWPGLPLYLETDAFLNYLYHQHKSPATPSRPYVKRKPRTLNQQQQVTEVRKYAKAFADWVKTDAQADQHRKYRLATWRKAKMLLGQQRVRSITRPEIGDLVRRFHCMRAVDINPARFLNGSNNSLRGIRTAWEGVLYLNGQPIEAAMRHCTDSLYGFGKSSVQELLGWFDPHTYPIRNANSNAGLRFFGYSVSQT